MRWGVWGRGRGEWCPKWQSGWEGQFSRTGNDFRALEVLVRVQIAGRHGKPQPDENEEEVDAAPHGRRWMGLLQRAQPKGRKTVEGRVFGKERRGRRNRTGCGIDKVSPAAE